MEWKVDGDVDYEMDEQEEDFDIPEQYQNPCKMTTEEERKQTPADVGGIDKMFE